jgi:hypothetical protein
VTSVDRRAFALCTAFRGVECGRLSRGALWHGSGFRGAVAGGLAADGVLEDGEVLCDGSCGRLVGVLAGVDYIVSVTTEKKNREAITYRSCSSKRWQQQRRHRH